MLQKYWASTVIFIGIFSPCTCVWPRETVDQENENPVNLDFQRYDPTPRPVKLYSIDLDNENYGSLHLKTREYDVMGVKKYGV